jgi:hypothetical protein
MVEHFAYAHRTFGIVYYPVNVYNLILEKTIKEFVGNEVDKNNRGLLSPYLC